MATTDRGEHAQQAILVDGSVARGLLDREGLVRMLDRAVTKRVTVVSAPPGSGKTSLLRVWARRSDQPSSGRVRVRRARSTGCPALLVCRLGRDPRPTSSVGPETLPAATASLDAEELVDRIVSELAEQVEPVVLVIDDVHELRSAEALGQLEHLLGVLPSSARLVLSSRRDPPIRLHQLRLADEVAEIRAGDLRFTERETRELLAASGINLSDGWGDRVAPAHRRVGGRLALGGDLPQRSSRSRAFRG